MSSVLKQAESILLSPFDLSPDGLAGLLQQPGTKLTYGDVFLQEKKSEHWSFEQSQVKGASRSYHRGAGIRKIVNGATGFAYSEQLDQKTLKQTAAMADVVCAPVDDHSPLTSKVARPTASLYEAQEHLLCPEQVSELFHGLDAKVRALDPRVESCQMHLGYEYEVMWVVNTQGDMAADIRPLIRFDITVVVAENGMRESAHMGGGGRYGFDKLIAGTGPGRWASEAVRMALLQLAAEPAPAGLMPVVLGPGWTGVLLHEAIGHGLEGDAISKGKSAFCDRLGQAIASSCCTVVDDGTLLGARGSLQVDDEGTPTQCTTLIEKGVLTRYMTDRYSAHRLNCEPTGNGRRESYAHLPLTRMTNTYLLPGNDDPQAIVASCQDGIYAKHFSGGQVDIASGKFVFTASEAYRIKNGKVAHPIKGVTLMGDGPSALGSISQVGNDLALDDGIGVCGKEGQSVPVGVGQPTVKLDKLTVGGTEVSG